MAALIYEDKIPIQYRADFVDKAKQVSNDLGIDPNWLMAIMAFETANTFSASKKNQIGCVGLLQFCPDTSRSGFKTIAGKKYSLIDLSKMTPVQQLDVVYEYLKQYKGQIKSYVDTYFAVFFPLAIGKDDNWVIEGNGLSAQEIYNDNPAFRRVKDGKIRVWEVKTTILNKLPKEWLTDGSFSLAYKAYKNYLFLGAALILGGYLIYRKYG